MEIGMVCWYGTSGSWLRESGILGTVMGGAFFGGFAVFNLVVMLALLERGPVEDAALKKTFGKEWEDYARKVPYSFIPGLW
jgi:protein-S-isoprenylcysteine O-methyltransferase Ste14